MLSFNAGSKKIVLGVVLLLCALVVKADEWKEAGQVVEKSTHAMLSLLEQSRLEAAQKSLVLLSNPESVLPFKPGIHVAVIGMHSSDQ